MTWNFWYRNLSTKRYLTRIRPAENKAKSQLALHFDHRGCEKWFPNHQITAIITISNYCAPTPIEARPSGSGVVLWMILDWVWSCVVLVLCGMVRNCSDSDISVVWWMVFWVWCDMKLHGFHMVCSACMVLYGLVWYGIVAAWVWGKHLLVWYDIVWHWHGRSVHWYGLAWRGIVAACGWLCDDMKLYGIGMDAWYCSCLWVIVWWYRVVFFTGIPLKS